MAEGILRAIFKEDPSVAVASAGTHALTGNPATEFSVLASRENGIDISGHRAQLLDSVLIRRSHVILCMEPAHAEWTLSIDCSASEKVYNLADFSGGVECRGKIDDPYGCSLREYRECFRIINECLRNFAGRLSSICSVGWDIGQ